MKLNSVFKLFLFWQFLIVFITGVSIALLPLRHVYIGGALQAYEEHPLLYSRSNFDGNHYTTISVRGYGYAQQAFFPLYPQLIKKLTPYFKLPVTAGLAISIISFFVGILVFIKLITLDYSQEVAKWAVLCLILFPTSFFFTSVYTEGLFFLLCVSCFYFARKKNWIIAGLLGALASYTRFIGIGLFPAILIEWWLQNKNQWKRSILQLLPILLIPLGLATYMYYLFQTTGDPLAFFHVQTSFGQLRSEKIILLYQVFWRYAKMILTVDRLDPSYLTIVLEVVTGILFLITSIYSLFKHRASYAFFNLFAYLIPTLTGSFVSLPRYVLICFPTFILFGQFMKNTNEMNRKLIFGAFAIIYFVYLTLFARGYWVS